jgi:G3E family GTPase
VSDPAARAGAPDVSDATSGPGRRTSTRRTPVTVVAGGAEAALLAARLGGGLVTGTLPERVAVIAEGPAPEDVGDLDWITVDALEGERTEGCPCCRSRLDLVRTLRQLVERPRPVDRAIVLVDAARDTSTVTQTLLAEPEMQRLVDLDGVVATVDARAMSTRLAVGMPFGDELEFQRLAVADRVIVSRAIDVTDDALGRLMRSLRTVNRLGFIAAPSITPLDMGMLVDLRAWHGAPTLAVATMTEPMVAGDGHLPVTVHCEVEGTLDPEAIDEWFDRVIAQHGARLLRLQGAVAVHGQEQRVCCRGVRSFAISHSEDEHPAGGRSERSVVALVGYGLDADTLRDEFASTRVR